MRYFIRSTLVCIRLGQKSVQILKMGFYDHKDLVNMRLVYSEFNKNSASRVLVRFPQRNQSISPRFVYYLTGSSTEQLQEYFVKYVGRPNKPWLRRLRLGKQQEFCVKSYSSIYSS